MDNSGNIALAKDPYSKAQDVASAARLFAGELYYDTGKGIPYFEETLGCKQSFALYRYRLVQAALGVPGVVGADAHNDAPPRRAGGPLPESRWRR